MNLRAIRSIFSIQGQIRQYNQSDLRMIEAVSLPDGRKFTGRFESHVTGDRLPSAGSMLEEDGNVYIGEYDSAWRRHGIGKAWLTDGTHFDGLFARDDFVKGTVVVPDGEESVIFTGTLRDEQFHTGTLKSRGIVYTGDFQANTPHGTGFMQLPRGGYLKGTFFRGKLHGTGTMRLENGYLYKGGFIKGLLPSGELRTQTFKYEGQLGRDGLPSGIGRGEMLTASEKLIFEGQWNLGRVVSGTCKDEHGTVVDYLNRPDLQRSLMGEEDLMMNEYCLCKRSDFAQRQKQVALEYLREAAASNTNDTSAVALGFEYGPVSSVSFAENKMNEQVVQDRTTHARAVPQISDIYKVHCSLLDVRRLGAEGVDVARMQREIRAEYGTLQLVRQNLTEQYSRFRRRNGMEVETTGTPNPHPKFSSRNELWTGYYT